MSGCCEFSQFCLFFCRTEFAYTLDIGLLYLSIDLYSIHAGYLHLQNTKYTDINKINFLVKQKLFLSLSAVFFLTRQQISHTH